MDNKAGTEWDSLGQAEFEMGKLIGSANSMLMLKLDHKGENMGTLIIRAEKVSKKNDILALDFGVKELTGFGFCSSQKPFIQYSLTTNLEF